MSLIACPGVRLTLLPVAGLNLPSPVVGLNLQSPVAGINLRGLL